MPLEESSTATEGDASGFESLLCADERAARPPPVAAFRVRCAVLLLSMFLSLLLLVQLFGSPPIGRLKLVLFIFDQLTN